MGRSPNVNSQLALSIVTPVKNRVDMVDACIVSAAKQSKSPFRSVEHLFVDGNSTDGTVERIESYQHCSLLPQKVTGIYDGMNAGIRAAKGDIICILNSDDQLAPDALDAVYQGFRDHPDAEVIAGRASVRDVEQPHVSLRHLPTPHDEGVNEWPVLLWGGVAINARFFRRQVFEKIGLFNTELSLASDREHLIRQRLAGIRSHSVDHVLYHYTAHKGSATMGQKNRNAMTVLNEHVSIMDWLRPQIAADSKGLSSLRKWAAIELSRRAILKYRSQDWSGAMTDLARATSYCWRTSRYVVYHEGIAAPSRAKVSPSQPEAAEGVFRTAR